MDIFSYIVPHPTLSNEKFKSGDLRRNRIHGKFATAEVISIDGYIR